MSYFSATNAFGRIIHPGETDNPLDMSRAPLVNEERLETLVYHRSKQWSSLMKNWADGDEGQELCVSDLEDIYKDEHEDPEIDGEEDEEAIEDPVPETKVDIGNISASMGVAELTLILCASEDNEAKAEMQEILNQTMPVVQEHKRKWKEAGLDRILDTFDEKQIEQHVGQWMRRNNSAFVEEAPPAKFMYVLDQASVSELSDESLHSIDTARYIRQSRRRVPNKISNTATIKMYRTHSHKRDELRAKYAYDDEQEHRHHMQTLLHRRREKERQVTYVSASPQHCLLSSGHHPRRKHRRKRHASSPVFDCSSSDEDDRSYGRCSCRSYHSLSRSASYQCCSYRGARDCHHHHRSVASRTMHHLRRQHSYDIDMDLRPRMRENECNCCTSDRLCSNVVHIANSSTEEWVVENCSPLVVETPKEFRRQPQQKHRLVTITKSNSKSKGHKQRLPKVGKTSATASKLLKSQVSLLGDTSDDEVEVSPRRRKMKPASAPVTARKMVKATPLTFKQIQVPPKQNKGSPDESEDDDMANVRLMAKNSKIEPGPVGPVPKKTSSKKPTFRTTNRLAQIPEEVTRPKDPEDQCPASSAQICKENDACSVEKTSSKSLETNSKLILDEQKTNKKSKISGHAPVDSSDSNEAKTSSKSRGKPKNTLDSGKKIATVNEEHIEPKIVPTNIVIVQSSDESEDEVKGRSRLVSFSAGKDLKTKSRTVKVAVDSSPPKKSGTSSKSRGRPRNSNAAPTEKKPKTKKTSSSAVAKEKVAIQSPDSQETVEAEKVKAKVKAPKVKISNQKSKKVESSNSARLDEATDSDDSEFQRALALSTESYKDEQIKRAQDEATSPENQPQSQSQSQSQIMFNNNSVACNSTALANDTAAARVLSPKKCGSKGAAAVSSTEAQSVEIISLMSSEECEVAQGRAPGGDADCTVVTSTTICEPPVAVAARKPPPLKIDKRGILLHNSSTAEGGANFTLTEQSLGEVIGERFARRYLKYHVGSRTFDSSHSVYYRPTPKLAKALRAASMDTQLLADLSTSGSSDDDVFEQIHKYGDVYSVAENGVKQKD